MISVDFDNLRDYILQHNTYFNQGFSNCYQDDLTGYILQGESDEKFAVGIDDRFGNYFYIRTETDIRYTERRPQLSDTSRSLDETTKCYLVAVVDNARPKELVTSLLNTLLNYGENKTRPVRAIYIREAAVQKELSKIDDKDAIIGVLQNLRDLQVVIVEFDFITQFTPVPFTCIPSPCKSCTDE